MADSDEKHFLDSLFENNRAWARSIEKARPGFFEALSKQFSQAAIRPQETRKRLVQTLEILRHKKEERPRKKLKRPTAAKRLSGANLQISIYYLVQR